MNDSRKKIHTKVVELARQMGRDASGLGYAESIPERAGLDSPALLELILWYETEFGLEIDQDQLTMDNFGTVEAMAAYLARVRP